MGIDSSKELESKVLFLVLSPMLSVAVHASFPFYANFPFFYFLQDKPFSAKPAYFYVIVKPPTSPN